jgi:hypothetical protein
MLILAHYLLETVIQVTGQPFDELIWSLLRQAYHASAPP